MLYLSRSFTTGELGVVDTDDGIEERASKYELLSIVQKHGLTIHGFELEGFSTILRVYPYQLPESATVLQTKLKMVTGVDVVVYDNTLVNVRWSKRLKHRVPIRVSDFAPNVGSVIFRGSNYSKGISVELIFDDKVQNVSSGAFMRAAGSWGLGVTDGVVLLNLEEVTNEEVCEAVYGALKRAGVYPVTCVKDKPSRLNAMSWR